MATRICSCCGRSYDDEDVFPFTTMLDEELWNHFFTDMAKSYRSGLALAKEAVDIMELSNGARKKIVTKIKNMIHDFGDEQLSDDEGVEMLSETTDYLKTRERLEKIATKLTEIAQKQIEQKGVSFDKYKKVNGLSYLRYIAPTFAGELYMEVSESVQRSAEKEWDKPFGQRLRQK